MTKDTVSPQAARIIEKCGGHRAVALLTGRSLAQVYRWTYSREIGGAGGIVPREPRDKLIRAAQAGLVDLVANDFVDLPVASRKRGAQGCS